MRFQECCFFKLVGRYIIARKREHLVYLYGRYRDDLIFIMDRFTAPLLCRLICAHAEENGYKIEFEQKSLSSINYLDVTVFKGKDWLTTGKL